MRGHTPIPGEVRRLVACYGTNPAQLRAIRAEALYHARHYRYWAREYATDARTMFTSSEYHAAGMRFRRCAAEARVALAQVTA